MRTALRMVTKRRMRLDSFRDAAWCRLAEAEPITALLK